MSRCAPRARTRPTVQSRHDRRARTTDNDATTASSGAAAAAELTSSSQDMRISPDRQWQYDGAKPGDEADDADLPGVALVRPTTYKGYRAMCTTGRTMTL